MAKAGLSIPVSAAFEKRLAELVWENCPALARETAAGKMAMSLEVDERVVHDIVIGSLRQSILEWAASQVDIVKEKVCEALDLSEIVEEQANNIRESVRTRTDFNDNQITGMVQSLALDEITIGVQTRLREYFGSKYENLPEIVQDRIDAYLERRFNDPPMDKAMEDVVARRSAGAKG